MRIRESDFASRFTLDEWIACCDAAFRQYGQGSVLNPPRTEGVERSGNLDTFRLRMPAEWVGRYRAEKVIEERSDIRAGRLGERSAVIHLTDLATGATVEMEAELITNLRTGAAGALGARYLAPSDLTVAAILGAGRIARALALCIDRLFDLTEVRVTSRRPETRAAFAEEVGPRLRAPLHVAESVPACVADAGAILTAVPTASPILRATDVRPDAHLSVMGGDPRTAQVGPDLLSTRAVLVDEPGQAAVSGEFRRAREEDPGKEIPMVRDASGRALTIGDAACGRLDYLGGTGVLTHFTGLAAQDLMAAVMVYEALCKPGGSA